MFTTSASEDVWLGGSIKKKVGLCMMMNEYETED